MRLAEFSDGRAVNMEYDSADNLTQLRLTHGHEHRFRYTESAALKEYDPPYVEIGNDVTYHTLNTDNQVVQIQRPDGEIIRFDYDLATGQLQSMIMPDETISYGYEALSENVSSVSSGSLQSLTYGYLGGVPRQRNLEW